MSVLPISRLNPATTVIAVQVGILVVDVTGDDVELVVVGVESAFKFSIGALMTEHPAVLDEVENFVATGPGVGFVFEAFKLHVRPSIEPISGRFRTLRDYVLALAVGNAMFQHGYYSSEK